jgi:hypothetical protein
VRIQQWLRLVASRKRQADRQTERGQLKPAAPGFRPPPSAPPALLPKTNAKPRHLAWTRVGHATRAGAPGDGRAAHLPRAPGPGHCHAVPPRAPAIRQLETERDKLLVALLETLQRTRRTRCAKRRPSSRPRSKTQHGSPF